jgi:peptidyl-prolyl cis-trans isomerase B (cyclophilin B)
MTTNVKRVLIAELLVAFVVIVGLLANQAGQVTATPSQAPTPSPTATQELNVVDGCDTAVTAKSSNSQWTSAPALDLDDDRTYWNLKTNCGEIVIEVFADKAPVTANTLRFLTDQKFYDATPCHRLTSSSFFVIQCGDPLGTGIGNPGFTIMEENRPPTGNANYPMGTVAMAKGTQPNSSGSQFFFVYRDTTLRPDYTVIGRVVVGMDIVTAIGQAGTVGGVQDGKPKQNFGIIEATFSSKKPKELKSED